VNAVNLRTGVGALLYLWLAGSAAQLAVAQTSVAEARQPGMLDVSIAAFDPGVPDDPAVHRELGVFPRIREIEARLLPFVLRDTLAKTREWGAVRVVPEPDAEAELLVTGVIERSDPESLILGIRAVDAAGRVWIDQDFRGVPGQTALYDEVAEALAAARAGFDERTLASIVEISLLRYGIWLAPSAFRNYLTRTPDGQFTLQRLPARDDPMLSRIRLVRETEYVITDAIDAKFRDLYAGISSVYDVWRDYRRKNLEYRARNAEWATFAGTDAPRGSFEALKAQYENYQRHRLTVQEQDRLAVAFDNEVGPKVVAMEERIAELERWVDQKYAEWHRLLEAIFEAETEIER
jgi:hypothetical protein